MHKGSEQNSAEKVSETFSDVPCDPSWTPVPNSGSSESLFAKVNTHHISQSNNLDLPHDESFKLDSLKSTEIVILNNSDKKPEIPEFQNPMDSESIDLQLIRESRGNGRTDQQTNEHMSSHCDNEPSATAIGHITGLAGLSDNILDTCSAKDMGGNHAGAMLPLPQSSPQFPVAYTEAASQGNSSQAQHDLCANAQMNPGDKSRLVQPDSTPASLRDGPTGVRKGVCDSMQGCTEQRFDNSTQHPLTSAPSQRDAAGGERVNVVVCDSGELQGITSLREPPPVITFQQSRQQQDRWVPTSQGHRHSTPPTNLMGDSGIAMDEITEAQGLMISGGQQLSAAFLNRSSLSDNQHPITDSSQNNVHTTVTVSSPVLSIDSLPSLSGEKLDDAENMKSVCNTLNHITESAKVIDMKKAQNQGIGPSTSCMEKQASEGLHDYGVMLSQGHSSDGSIQSVEEVIQDPDMLREKGTWL